MFAWLEKRKDGGIADISHALLKDSVMSSMNRMYDEIISEIKEDVKSEIRKEIKETHAKDILANLDADNLLNAALLDILNDYFKNTKA